MDKKIQKLTTAAMLCALAYVSVALIRIPVVSFLKYEPKDVIIAIGGFTLGPLTAFLISLVVSTVEMFTVSETGPFGLLMNIISTCAFACVASLIYKKKRTMSGAVIGLICGAVSMTVLMMLWNYLITPLYMGVEREAVVEMLIPTFLPFNLIKSSLNAGLTLLVYKPVVSGLRKAHLMPPSPESNKGGLRVGVLIASVAVLITCVLIILALNDII